MLFMIILVATLSVLIVGSRSDSIFIKIAVSYCLKVTHSAFYFLPPNFKKLIILLGTRLHEKYWYEITSPAYWITKRQFFDTFSIYVNSLLYPTRVSSNQYFFIYPSSDGNHELSEAISVKFEGGTLKKSPYGKELIMSVTVIMKYCMQQLKIIINILCICMM